MGRKDMSQSDFFADKSRFSDLFNGIIFQGEPVIKAEELKVEDSVVTWRGGSKAKKLISDKSMRWKNIVLTVLILETQDYVDYFMVPRVVKKEIAIYDAQRREGYSYGLSNGAKPDGNEFLSHMFKFQKLNPVITLVLYTGEEIWDGGKELYDMMMVPEELKPFVMNYKINFYDYRECNHYEIFKTDNALLFQLLNAREDKGKMKQIILREIEEKRCKDLETMAAILGITGMKFDIESFYDKEMGGYDMCKAMEEWEQEIREQALTEGEHLGRIEGERLGKISGRMDSLMCILSELGKVDSSLQERLRKLADSSSFAGVLKLAYQATSLDEFKVKLSEVGK